MSLKCNNSNSKRIIINKAVISEGLLHFLVIINFNIQRYKYEFKGPLGVFFVS